MAVVAAGVAHVDAFGVGLDADRDYGEAERAGECDGAVRDASACRVAFGVADETPREPELVESVLDNLLDFALVIDRAQHGPNAGLAQVAQRALDRVATAARRAHARSRRTDPRGRCRSRR